MKLKALLSKAVSMATSRPQPMSSFETVSSTRTLPVLRKPSHLNLKRRSCEAEDIYKPGSLSISPYLKNKLIQRRKQRNKQKSTIKEENLLTAVKCDVSDDHYFRKCKLTPLKQHFVYWERKKMFKYSSSQIRELFTKAIRVARTVVRILMLIRSDKNTERRLKEMTAEELHYYSIQERHFSSEELTLHFHKLDYSATNQIFMPKWARQMMNCSPNDRSAHEVKKLAVLFRMLKSFKQRLSPEAQIEFCYHCIYARYEKQRVIVRRGHPGEFFYIIFSGSVFVNIEDKDKDGRSFTRTDCVLGEGTLFGEISLFNDMPRSATIVCREDTECVMVDKEVLRRICPDKMERETILKLDTMRDCGLFEIWPSEIVQQICKHSKVEEYGYNKVIEKDTSASEFVYIVTAGRVEVVVSLTPSYPKDGVCSLRGSESLPAYLPGMPHPEPRVMQKSGVINTSKERVFISVHTLLPYDCCDLASLLKGGESRGLILVSFGSTVMRIPKQQLISMAPLKCWRDLQCKARAAKRYPGDAMLNRVYLESCQWKCFKHLTISDTLDRLRGCPYAAKPATSKGTSGPAVFPGVVHKEVLPPLKQNCLFCDNVVSVPTQEMKDANNHLPRI